MIKPFQRGPRVRGVAVGEISDFYQHSLLADPAPRGLDIGAAATAFRERTVQGGPLVFVDRFTITEAAFSGTTTVSIHSEAVWECHYQGRFETAGEPHREAILVMLLEAEAASRSDLWRGWNGLPKRQLDITYRTAIDPASQGFERFSGAEEVVDEMGVVLFTCRFHATLLVWPDTG